MCIIPSLKDGATVAAACEMMTQAFRARGIEQAQTDARILAADALGLKRAEFVAQADRLLKPREIEAISARAARRLKREPVSRIVGFREFWSLNLLIDNSVLDPRPETETVVELALDWIITRGLRNEQLRILDIGTGSGALLLALLSELKNAYGVGTDISPVALALARENSRQLGLGQRAGFIACDFASALQGPFDLVVSNPPYIRSGEIPALAPEVRDYDPRKALDGGADGLVAYRIIAADAPRLLASRGRLIVELGFGQEGAVNALIATAGLSVENPARKDLGGISRALSASAP